MFISHCQECGTIPERKRLALPSPCGLPRATLLWMPRWFTRSLDSHDHELFGALLTHWCQKSAVLERRCGSKTLPLWPTGVGNIPWAWKENVMGMGWCLRWVWDVFWIIFLFPVAFKPQDLFLVLVRLVIACNVIESRDGFGVGYVLRWR